MAVGGVAVLALAFAIQAEALSQIDIAEIFKRAPDTAVAESASVSLGS